MGSIENWDFLAFYAKSGYIFHIAASESRRK